MALKKIRELLAKILGYSDENEIELSLSLFEDLEMDGNEYDTFIYDLEEMFDIEIEEEAVDSFEYVKDVVAYINKQID